MSADRDRDVRLLAAGWRVARFMWADVVRHPARVTARLSDLLASPGPDPGPRDAKT
jgi:very-short-patch-repair endonuclease